MKNRDSLSNVFRAEAGKYAPNFLAAAIISENPRMFDADMEAVSSAAKQFAGRF